MYPYNSKTILENKSSKEKSETDTDVYKKKLLELLEMSAKDELKDINYYKKLVSKAKDEVESKLLKDIYMNSAKHYNFLKKIFLVLTAEEMIDADDFIEDYVIGDLEDELEKSLFKELEDVEFYRQFSSFFEDEDMLKMLYEIITDKQNNGIKLTYLLGR